ncbi:MAG: HAD family phosphatase [Bacteroidota bacterium]
MHKIKNIIFDLGGVLMDWNPKYLYSKIFHNEEKMNWFLDHVCTAEWNTQQDAGRSFEEGTKLLISQYPEYKEAITAYDFRWEETIRGTLPEAVNMLENLVAKKKYRIFALTNWSQEKFPLVRHKYTFFQLFEDILVSGEEKLIKPDPEIYQLALQRFGIKAEESIFIDDSKKNVIAAEQLGFQVIHYLGTDDLKKLNHLLD